jgi:hypothetical protein
VLSQTLLWIEAWSSPVTCTLCGFHDSYSTRGHCNDSCNGAKYCFEQRTDVMAKPSQWHVDVGKPSVFRSVEARQWQNFERHTAESKRETLCSSAVTPGIGLQGACGLSLLRWLCLLPKIFQRSSRPGRNSLVC